MICVISKDIRCPPSKHDFWKMPFDKKISTKHITSKCHFTPLTLSGTRVKQLAWSKASRRIQVTVGWMYGRRLPAEGTAPKCLCLSALAVCNKYHAFLKTYWSKNEFSEYDFSSFSSCWMLSDVQGTPLSVLCSIFIDVQNSLFTIQKWSLHSKTFSSSIYREGLLFCFVFLSLSLFFSAKTWIWDPAHPAGTRFSALFHAAQGHLAISWASSHL